MAFNLGSAQASIGLSVDGEKDSAQKIATVGDALNSVASTAKTALVALGLFATASHFKDLIMGAISAQAALKELSERTGTAVETLSGLKGVAKLSGTDMESVGSALQKLSKSMVAGSEDGNKAAASFKAIGVTAKEMAAGMNDPGQMMVTIAKRLEDFKDGAGKTSAMMELFGRTGANLLPMMKDLAEKGQIVATVTTEQALAADALEKQMIVWDNRMKGLYSTIAIELVPALNDFMAALIAAHKESDELSKAAKGLAADGSIKTWANDIAQACAFVVDSIQGVVTAVKTVGTIWGAWVAEVKNAQDIFMGFYKVGVFKEFSEGTEQIKSGAGAIKSIWTNLKDDLEKLWGDSANKQLGEKLASVTTARVQVAAAAAMNQFGSFLSDGSATQEKKILKPVTASVTAALSEYDKLIKKISGELNKATGEAEAAQHGYNKSQAEFIALAGSDEWKKLTNAQRAVVAQLFEQKIAQEKVTEAGKWDLDNAKAQAAFENEMAAQKLAGFAAQHEAQNSAVKSSEDALKAAQDEYDQYGKTKSQIAALTLETLELAKAKLAANDDFEYYNAAAVATQKQIDNQKALVAVLQKSDLRATLDAENKSILDSLDRTAHDTFVSIANGAKDAGTRIKDALKNTFFDWLYSMTLKKWVIDVGASVTGASAYAQQSAGGGSTGTVGNALNAGSSLFSAFSGPSAGYMNFAGSGIGQTLGLSSTANFVGPVAEFAPATAGLTGLGSAIGNMLPFLGLAVAGFTLLGSIFEDGPEQSTYFKFRSNATPGSQSVNARGNEGNTTDSYVGGRGINSAFGSFGVSETFWANDKQLPGFLTAVKKVDDTLANILTEGEQSLVKSYLTTKEMKVGTGAEGADTSEALALVFADRIRNIFEGVETGLSALVTGFAGTSDQLAQEAASLLGMRKDLDAYAKVIGEPVTLQSMAALKAEGESSAQAITRLVSTFRLTDDAAMMLGKTTEAAFGAIGLAGDTAREAMVKAAGGLQNFGAQTTAYYAGFFTDEQRRTNTVAQASTTLNDAFGNLGVAVPTTHAAFTALLASFDTTTEAGRASYQSVMNVSGAFTTINGTAQQAADGITAAAQQMQQSIAAFQSSATGGASLEMLQGNLNTAMLGVTGSSPWITSIEQLMTQTQVDFSKYTEKQQASIIAARQAYQAYQQKLAQGSQEPITQGNPPGYSETVAETVAAALPTHALEIELLRLQGRALEALNLSRADETQSLSDSDKALKLQIYALQDLAATQSLRVQLLNAEGKTYEATVQTRALALSQMTAENAAIQMQIDLVTDRAKTQALQLQIDTLLGDAGAVLASTREKELLALSPTDRALQEHIYQLQDQATAAKAATSSMSDLVKQMDGVAALKSSIAASMQSIRGPDTAGAVAAARAALAGAVSIDERTKAAGTLQSAIMAHYQEQTNAATALHQKQEAASQQAIAAANQLNAAYRKIGEYATSLLTSKLSVLSPEQQLAEAKKQYQSTLASAQSGDQSAADALQGVTQTYLDQARAYYASNEDYVRIFTTVQGALTAIGSRAGPEQIWQENTVAWQGELSGIQTDALKQLEELSKLTDKWQEELQAQMVEQAIVFAALGVNTAQIAANTNGLDTRIGAAIAAAIAAQAAVETVIGKSIHMPYAPPSESLPSYAYAPPSESPEMMAKVDALLDAIILQTRAANATAEAVADANDKAVETQTAVIERLPLAMASAVNMTGRR